ncbi:MAG: IS630 family transposase [Kiritimatiellia bacterium]|jgi:transposase
MQIKNAREISTNELFERRKQAVALYNTGMLIQDIAPIVGAHRNVVGRWIRLWESGGEKALKPAKPGRPKGSGRRLTPEQEKSIAKALVDKCPDQLKMPFALWTRAAVQEYIQRKHGVALPLRSVGRCLRRWGFTPQRPVRRAYERNPAAVERWLAETYPMIKARAEEEGGEIHWGDETGIHSDDVNGRGYAPKGRTPVRRAKGTAEKTDMISTVTNQGKVRFMFYHGGMCASVLLLFLERLIRSSEAKVFLVLDNLKVHHSKPVKEWLEENSKRIELFYLPSYSPDLNPDEYLNCDLKGIISRKPDARCKGHLKRTALGAMRSIQKQPRRVRSYFEHESIIYAS